MEPDQAVAALAALAQRSRLAIFRRLVECGLDGAHPTELAQHLQLPPNTLSFHLKALEHAGLVSTRQNGRFIRYTANFALMQSLVGYLTENCCAGKPELCVPRPNMHPAPFQVLFVCTGNSARSILSEATLNAIGGGRFIAHSAGSQPTGRVNPFALAQLEASGIATGGYRSKSWDEFCGPGAPPLDLVITVCGNADAESCPVFFGDFIRVHWGLPDPAAVHGADEQIAAAFAEAHRVIRHRLQQLVTLPLETLSAAQWRAQLEPIGHSLP